MSLTAQGVIRVCTVVEFRTALGATLQRCGAQLTVIALKYFLFGFVFLGHVHVIFAVLDGIGTEAAVRPDCVRILRMLHLVVHLVTHVPIPDAVEVDVAHLVSVEFADEHTILINFTSEVVTWLSLDNAHFVPASNVILFVFEFALTTNVVHQCSIQRIQDFVLLGCVCDQGSILE